MDSRVNRVVREAGTRKPLGSSNIDALLTGLMRPSTRSRLDDFAIQTFVTGICSQQVRLGPEE